MDNVLEWLGTINTISVPLKTTPSSHNQVHWQPPTSEILKYNIDASFIHNSDFIGVCWIVCGETGAYLLYASSKLKQDTNSLEAEDLAMLHAIHSLYCRGYRRILMQSDCTKLIGLLHNHKENATLNPLLVDIRSWTNHFSSILFTSVLRKYNQITDKLAKSGSWS